MRKKLNADKAMLREVKSLWTRKRKVPYVSHPNPNKQMVSLKMPEPQTKTLGINKIEIAIGWISFGYNDAKVLKRAQMPLNDIKANIMAVGK